MRKMELVEFGVPVRVAGTIDEESCGDMMVTRRDDFERGNNDKW
jgi:hypothetical protein